MADIKGIELASEVYGLEDEQVRDDVETNTSAIGNLASLATTAKSNLVAAINEVKNEADSNETAIGTLTDLRTTTKSNLVAAINEVLGRIVPQKIIYTKDDSIYLLLKAAEKWGTTSTKALVTFYNSDGSISWIGEIQWLGNTGGNITSIVRTKKGGANTITAINTYGTIALSQDVAYTTLEYIGEHD